MPLFESVMSVSRPVEEVFAFFSRPANLIRMTPPELHLRLVEGPERLQLGSRIVLQGRRWGIPQRLVSQVTVYEPSVRFVDEQVEGPFPRWAHTHAFEAVPEGTRLTDQIEYEPPAGVLGLLVTASVIERDLHWVFDFRKQKLEELLQDP